MELRLKVHNDISDLPVHILFATGLRDVSVIITYHPGDRHCTAFTISLSDKFSLLAYSRVLGLVSTFPIEYITLRIMTPEQIANECGQVFTIIEMAYRSLGILPLPHNGPSLSTSAKENDRFGSRGRRRKWLSILRSPDFEKEDIWRRYMETRGCIGSYLRRNCKFGWVCLRCERPGHTLMKYGSYCTACGKQRQEKSRYDLFREDENLSKLAVEWKRRNCSPLHHVPQE